MLKLKTKNIFLVLAALILLFFLNYLHLFDAPKNILINSFLPLQERITFFIPRNDKIDANSTDLKEDLAKIQLKLLQEENEKLRQSLNFLTTNNYIAGDKNSFTLANVIGRDPLTFTSTLILDKGKLRGVNIGDAVIEGEGILIGKIINTEDNISYFAPITSSQIKIASIILDNENLQGIVEGSHGLSLKMNLIPLDKKINIGDMIITSGLEKNIPRGLLIGKVEEINTESNDLFQNITLKPAVNLSDLNIVIILLGKNLND